MSGRPALALLHGGGQGSWVWDETAAALRDSGADVLVLDVPGCGAKRDRDTAALGVDAVADELLADIAAAGLTHVVLVGHSQGGTVLPVMARRSPALFRRLVYVAACAPLPGQSIVDMMGRGVRGSDPDEVGWPLDPARDGRDVQRPIMFCNDMTDDQATAFLARLGRDSWPMPVTLATGWDYDTPTGVAATYVVCERDGVLPTVWQRRFGERLHVDRVITIDAGHQAMNTQPQALARLLLEAAAA